MTGRAEGRRRLAAHGRVGALLVAVCWAANACPGEGVLRTHLLFFPLWLGAILLGDALVLARSGRSLLTDGALRFAGLFAVSVPIWWLFEALNLRTANWEYLGRERFSDLEYALLGSLSFSTVVPAVFTAAELLLTFAWVRRRDHWRLRVLSRRAQVGLFAAGWLGLGLVLAWPRVAYPLLWVAPMLVAEPVNLRLGRPSALADLACGAGPRVLALLAGSLACGLLWEMWNAGSYPRWIYHTPGAGFLYLFEMPLLGYLGYLPFGLALFALTHLLWPGAPVPAIPPQHGSPQ